MTYENLLQEAADENVYVIEDAPFQSLADGLIRNDVIGINRTVRQSTKRACACLPKNLVITTLPSETLSISPPMPTASRSSGRVSGVTTN